MQRRPKMAIRCLALTVAVMAATALWMSPAMAGPFKWLGYDTAAVGSANSQVSYGSSYSVLATNPALMSRFAPRGGIEFLFYKPQLSIELMDRPANADVPFVFYSSKIGDATTSKDRALPTIELKNARGNTDVEEARYFIGAGGTHNLGIKGFRLGGLILLPLPDQVSMSTYFPNEQEQYFSNKLHMVRFGEWSPIVSGMLGVSYAPPSFNYLSFGAALAISVSASASMDLYMPSIQAEDYAKSNMNMAMALSLRPIIGIQAEPTDWMAIGLTWKLWSYMDVDGAGNMLLWNYRKPPGAETESRWEPKRVSQEDHDYALDYEPMELTLGIGFDFSGWEIQAAVTWNHWSAYLNNHHESPQDSAQYLDVIADSEAEDSMYTPPVIDGDDYKFKETFSVTASASWQYVDWAKTTLGFGYYPSPVPAQDGRTNYVDSDVMNFALGQRFDFKLFGSKFYTQLGLQFWYMTERVTYKDPAKIIDEFPDDAEHIFEGTAVPSAKGLQTNNPGFPGYTVSGWMIAGAANVGMEF